MWEPTYQYSYHPDELYHHGILGQKWGKRNGPPYPLNPVKDYSKEEKMAKQNLKGSIQKNVEDWGKSRNNNILYITGRSGSGKSTVANTYKGASVIHLDNYIDKSSKDSRNKELDDFLVERKFDVNKMRDTEIDPKERFKAIDEFAEKHLQDFSKAQFDKGKKVVVEGVQLADETMFPDKSFFKDKPTITLKTNAFQSTMRAMKRDEEQFSFSKMREKISNSNAFNKHLDTFSNATSKGKELASSKYKEAKSHEPKITKDVVSAANMAGSKMFGLDHKLKTEDSLARKIDKNVKEDGVSPNDAAKDIKDAVRYTTITNDDKFVSNYNKVKKSLEDKGYTETRCKNYFDLYNQGKVKHKSVQCNYKTPDGYEFEIQFHTPSSQNAKTKKIPIYEESRQVGINPKRKAELIKQMETLAEQVAEPKDIYKIKSH